MLIEKVLIAQNILCIHPKQPKAETSNKSSVVLEIWLADKSTGLPSVLYHWCECVSVFVCVCMNLGKIIKCTSLSTLKVFQRGGVTDSRPEGKILT